VVAGEVRNLAQRSATAAKEIKNLITSSNTQIEAGNQQVQAAGQTVRQIVQAIQSLSGTMGNTSISRGMHAHGGNPRGRDALLYDVGQK
jgi:methyl-accepting chemotaxis protein